MLLSSKKNSGCLKINCFRKITFHPLFMLEIFFGWGEKNLFQILLPKSDQIVSLASYSHPINKYSFSRYYVLDTPVVRLPDVVLLWPFLKAVAYSEAPSFVTLLENPETLTPTRSKCPTQGPTPSLDPLCLILAHLPQALFSSTWLQSN